MFLYIRSAWDGCLFLCGFLGRYLSSDKRATSTLFLCLLVASRELGAEKLVFMQENIKKDTPLFLEYLTPDGKQRWFKDDCFFRLKEEGGEFYDREFVFISEFEREIYVRYSQLCRIYWDDVGNMYIPLLILPGGKRVEIVGLSVLEFLQLCGDRRLKTVRRKLEGGLYTSSSKRYKDIFIDECGEWRGCVDCENLVREKFVKPFLAGDVDLLVKEGGARLGVLFDIEICDMFIK